MLAALVSSYNELQGSIRRYRLAKTLRFPHKQPPNLFDLCSDLRTTSTMQDDRLAMKPPTAPQSFLLTPSTSFPMTNSSFLPNTQLLLSQLNNLSGLNLLGLQQQLRSLAPQQHPTVGSLPAVSADVASQAKRKMEHAELSQNPTQPKAQRSSGGIAAPSTSNLDVVQKLIKEREDLSAALKASNEEVVRLREVVAQIMDSDQRTKSEDDTDDSSHAQRRYWNEDEHQRFLEGLEKYGPKSVKAIAEYVGTRTATQVRTHAQKYYQKLARIRKAEVKTSGDELSGMSTEACESSTEQSSEACSDGKDKESSSPDSDPKDKESSNTPEGP